MLTVLTTRTPEQRLAMSLNQKVRDDQNVKLKADSVDNENVEQNDWNTEQKAGSVDDQDVECVLINRATLAQHQQDRIERNHDCCWTYNN